MGPSGFTVIYDACILYSAVNRDFFMRLGKSSLFRACWTRRIQDEWANALLRDRPDIDPARLERTKSLMNRSSLDCLVEGYEPLIEGLELPDKNDRHVLAAAIKSGASEIITFNLKDFPESALRRFGLNARHPDEFAASLFDLSTAEVLLAARRQRESLKSPPLTVDEFVSRIRSAGLPKTAKRLEGYSSEL